MHNNRVKTNGFFTKLPSESQNRSILEEEFEAYNGPRTQRVDTLIINYNY